MDISETINRKLIHRLVMRELRELFRRNDRARPNPEPQNIWETNYFTNLDEFVRDDNIRLQQVVRNAPPPPPPLPPPPPPPLPPPPGPGFQNLRDEMLEELRRLRGIMQGEPPEPRRFRTLTNRDTSLLCTVLDEMEVHVSLVKNVIFIHKVWGLFEISLYDSNVHFIPGMCLRCKNPCYNNHRHICIVQQSASNNGICVVRDEDTEEGYVDVGLNSVDLLILSKAMALENNLLPYHVINQIRYSFRCNDGGPSMEEILPMRKLMERDFDTNGISGAPFRAPPPPGHVNVRTRIMEELRTLFRRARNRRNTEDEAET